MGWHTVLMQRSLDLDAGKRIDAPTGQTLMLASGTPNFKMMAAAGWLDWSMRYGLPRDVTAALGRCVELLRMQTGAAGMMLTEQLPGDPHANFHLWPVAKMRWLAGALGSQGGQGAELFELTGKWFRLLRRLFDSIRGVDHRDQRPRLWPVGMRCEGAPTSQVWDEADRTLAGDPHARYFSPAAPAFYGVRLMLELLKAGDKLGGAPTAADVPRLAVPMHVVRAGDRIQVWLERPSWVTDEAAKAVLDGHNSSLGPYVEPCDWIDANVQTGEYSFGKFWKTPRPGMAAALAES